MTKKPFLLALSVCFATILTAQDQIPRLAQLDVQHYRFAIGLSDTSDEIQGEAQITIKFLKALSSFDLDLHAYQAADGNGMTVGSVLDGDQKIAFEQQGEVLRLTLATPAQTGTEMIFLINYHGIPADGLIIDSNKHGHRTFFGDNWPNRAHHWLPSVDHPSDKASVEFVVTAPEHYQVIANGIQVEETNLLNGQKLTHWREAAPIPTKVMVVGAADFAVQLAGEVDGVPISSWVYPEDRKAGFYDYGQALEVFPFFVEKVGPYSYAKLANVQSKTRYGGMENASNIFYFENSVNGKREREGLIAHEIAHQWFGNSASEGNWFHVWLSEGFATYFTTLYTEDRHGREAANELLLEDRQQIINFVARNDSPIINTQITNYNELLNVNSYQKGGWVLHMLRRQVGDAAFWQGIREYYATYRNSNALTGDLQKIMEKAAGQPLDTFFQQWLYRGGIPVIAVKQAPTRKRNRLTLDLRQLQSGPAYEFPLDILVHTKNGLSRLFTIRMNRKEQSETIKVKGEVERIELDPYIWLLFEEKGMGDERGH